MKKRIVIADDFENTRWVIEQTVRSLNCEILSAEDGEQALRYFDGKAIDLLITDLNMPKLNGIDLVRKVKQIPQYVTIPVIMLTTEKSMEKRQQAQDVKITIWVQKPFKFDDFLKIVKKCLQIS